MCRHPAQGIPLAGHVAAFVIAVANTATQWIGEAGETARHVIGQVDGPTGGIDDPGQASVRVGQGQGIAVAVRDGGEPAGGVEIVASPVAFLQGVGATVRPREGIEDPVLGLEATAAVSGEGLRMAITPRNGDDPCGAAEADLITVGPAKAQRCPHRPGLARHLRVVDTLEVERQPDAGDLQINGGINIVAGGGVDRIATVTGLTVETIGGARSGQSDLQPAAHRRVEQALIGRIAAEADRDHHGTAGQPGQGEIAARIGDGRLAARADLDPRQDGTGGGIPQAPAEGYGRTAIAGRCVDSAPDPQTVLEADDRAVITRPHGLVQRRRLDEITEGPVIRRQGNRPAAATK
ncbi:MAG: hypothetical protein AADX96_21830 [Thiocapsa sp. C3-sup]